MAYNYFGYDHGPEVNFFYSPEFNLFMAASWLVTLVLLMLFIYGLGLKYGKMVLSYKQYTLNDKIDVERQTETTLLKRQEQKKPTSMKANGEPKKPIAQNAFTPASKAGN
ncbi:hypothetical protein QR680_000547 [Steinernema hermaphroditum]|uniref:Uncharacterized protein n=1 Tax=Steinernema hermaphroditum TaxID=289476 RepID=A0AA39GUZ4_9BILA|nr:hypothetical protein QR680_000547 [Steinernema hermaphroditum]